MKKGRDRYDRFSARHIGPGGDDTSAMLDEVGAESLDALIDETVPASIRLGEPLDLPPGLSEHRLLRELRAISK